MPEPIPEVVLGYGLLYNWYAATDVRGVAPDGWRIPAEADFTILYTTISSNFATLKSGRLAVDGNPYWDLGSEGNNTSGFNAFGAGSRSGTTGEYFLFTRVGYYLSITGSAGFTITMNLGAFGEGAGNQGFANGGSIRCLRDTVPPAATVTDADGNLYTWVLIGAQYWLAESLKTTKYNNGADIVTGLDNAAWAATEEGAWAYPNGDPSLPI